MASAASRTVATRRVMVVLTGTTSRGSAFRRESSEAGRKRLKRRCQFSMQRRASSSAAGVAAQTPQREPKQSNLMRVWGSG